MALGWHVTGRGDDRVWAHAGGTYGCTSYVAFNPVKKVGLVLLTDSGIHGWIPVAGTQLFDFLCGRAYRIPDLPRAMPLPLDQLPRYEGRYRYAHDGSTARVVVERDHLRLKAEDEPDAGMALFPLGPGRFMARSAAAGLKFESDPATGRILSLTLYEGARPYPALRL
jgi:hypothetical protein